MATQLIPLIALIPLSQLVRVLSDLADGPLPPTVRYSRLYRDTLDGHLPTELVNGRNFVRPEAVPAIAARMGVTLRPDAPLRPPAMRARKSRMAAPGSSTN